MSTVACPTGQNGALRAPSFLRSGILLAEMVYYVHHSSGFSASE